MLDRLTPAARQMLSAAQAEARELGHPKIDSAHLVLGALNVTSPTSTLLQTRGITASPARTRLAQLRPAGVDSGTALTSLAFTDAGKSAVTAGIRTATAARRLVEVSDIIIAALRGCEPVLASLLAGFGTDPSELADALEADSPGRTPEFAGSPSTPAMAAPAQRGAGTKPSPTLANFAVDLTARAEAGELDPVEGRDDVIDRLEGVLCRRTKNNPVLVGEPGVGKTAVVEGLAQRIAAGTVAEPLAGKRIWSIDLGSIMAGTRYRGDMEERMKKLMAEAAKPENILFIDEIHSLVSSGAAGGSLGMADILKPALARSELAVIGATTADEFRKYFEKDAAMERRFQPITVGEPSITETIAILGKTRVGLEAHHNVKITDGAIKAAAELTSRVLPDRRLPDKAIDILDEAAAAARIARMHLPAEVAAWYKERDELRAVAVQDRTKGVPGFDQIVELTDRILTAEGNDLDVIDETQIAKVISTVAGVDLTAVTDGEADRLIRLEDELRCRVVGQADAVSAVARAVRRRRAGLGDTTRPPSFLFAGPTGVGKTELARTLAEFLFGDESAMVVIDMSEYMEKHTVSRLIGAAPGLVGHGEGGQLTEPIRRRPNALILLDEIDKAHPDVLNVCLQLLDDGRLTDGQGRKVDFSNTIVVMTSNHGTHQLKPSAGFRTGDAAEASAELTRKVTEAIKEALKPEFLNRIDEVIVFRSLTDLELVEIIHRLLSRVRALLDERGVSLELTNAAIDFLLRCGDATLGARPLRRAIQAHVENGLADVILAAGLHDGDVVAVDVGITGGLTLTVLPSIPEDVPELVE